MSLPLSLKTFDLCFWLLQNRLALLNLKLNKCRPGLPSGWELMTHPSTHSSRELEMALSWPWKDEDGYQCPEDAKNMKWSFSGSLYSKGLGWALFCPFLYLSPSDQAMNDQGILLTRFNLELWQFLCSLWWPGVNLALFCLCASWGRGAFPGKSSKFAQGCTILPLREAGQLMGHWSK